jgi:predicted Zn-dependent protease
MATDGGAQSVAQVLLFHDETLALELAPVLWPAFREVERFWALQPDRPTFTNYLWGRVPVGDATISKLGVPEPAKDLKNKQWERSRGKLSRTVDPDHLGKAVRDLLETSPDIVVVVTDQELMPPPNWRYMIACDATSVDGMSLVSTAPIDPRYWSQDSADRLSIIKHRVRSAVLGIVGEWLGVRACDNPQCVMCEPLDTVYALDSMVMLGKEHPIPELAMRGFDPRPDNPANTQPIVIHPVPPTSMAM